VNWLSWLRRPTTAWVLAGLVLVQIVALIPLSLAARQNPLATEGAGAQGGTSTVVAVSCAVVGLMVAWHRSRNPIGWLMLFLAVSFVFSADSGLYDVLNYRLGHQLPLAPVVLVLYHVSEPQLVLVPLIVMLFPDGRLPSPRWLRRVIVGCLVLAVIDMVVQGQMSVYAVTRHRTEVDTSGQLLLSNYSHYSLFYAPVGITFFAFWALAAGYQVVSWRNAAGERRQQLSWLMAGGVAAFAFFLAAVFADAAHGGWQVLGGVLLTATAVLPAGMGVAILKYRLYEIDRIISRTLAYAIVTGLLVGVYAGLVLLAEQVLRFHSTVAVAVSTLAAAALFSPLRSRVQRMVDRRFNRVRYDGERMVDAFAARLKDAADLDMVRADLAGVVSRALEPAHVSVWTARRE
jgi:hypothetical protein